MPPKRRHSKEAPSNHPGVPPKPVLKRVKAKGVSAVVLVPRIEVCVKAEANEHEGGSMDGNYGDVIIKGRVVLGSRFQIAAKLRELAEFIAGTVGDPMERASITVLMSRPRS